MLERAKFENKKIPKSPKLSYFCIITVFIVKLDILSLFHQYSLKLTNEKLFHGRIKIIFLVTVKMLFIF